MENVPFANRIPLLLVLALPVGADAQTLGTAASATASSWAGSVALVVVLIALLLVGTVGVTLYNRWRKR